jgi:hypothetical protein
MWDRKKMLSGEAEMAMSNNLLGKNGNNYTWNVVVLATPLIPSWDWQQQQYFFCWLMTISLPLLDHQLIELGAGVHLSGELDVRTLPENDFCGGEDDHISHDVSGQGGTITASQGRVKVTSAISRNGSDKWANLELFIKRGHL